VTKTLRLNPLLQFSLSNLLWFCIKRIFAPSFHACSWRWLYKKTPKHKARFGQYRMPENIVFLKVIISICLFMHTNGMHHRDINCRDGRVDFVCRKYWIVCLFASTYHSTATRSLWLQWSLLCPQHLSCPTRSACSWQAYSLVDVRRTSLRTLE
jgi:hypothetical protein